MGFVLPLSTLIPWLGMKVGMPYLRLLLRDFPSSCEHPFLHLREVLRVPQLRQNSLVVAIDFSSTLFGSAARFFSRPSIFLASPSVRLYLGYSDIAEWSIAYSWASRKASMNG